MTVIRRCLLMHGRHGSRWENAREPPSRSLRARTGASGEALLRDELQVAHVLQGLRLRDRALGVCDHQPPGPDGNVGLPQDLGGGQGEAGPPGVQHPAQHNLPAVLERRGTSLYSDPNLIGCKGETINDPKAHRVVDTRYTTITTSTEPMALPPAAGPSTSASRPPCHATSREGRAWLRAGLTSGTHCLTNSSASCSGTASPPVKCTRMLMDRGPTSLRTVWP